jgi:hypothetical protein
VYAAQYTVARTKHDPQTIKYRLIFLNTSAKIVHIIPTLKAKIHQNFISNRFARNRPDMKDIAHQNPLRTI